MSALYSPFSLQCQQLSCERDGRVLFSHLDLAVKPGDILQVEGPNGSGKTTLLRTLTTLLRDYHGEIKWNGESIHRVLTDFRSQLLFLGHLPGVKKTLSPRENLRFLCQLQQAVDANAIDAALDKVGLYGYEDLPGYQLSAGQLRRIALARLYLTQASLWVLDEPYTAIDKEGVAQLEQHFIEHAQKGGAVILTTHQSPNMPELKRINLLDYAPLLSEYEGESEGEEAQFAEYQREEGAGE